MYKKILNKAEEDISMSKYVLQCNLKYVVISPNNSFVLKILGRQIKSKALLLKVKLHLYLAIDFLIASLGSLNNLVSRY